MISQKYRFHSRGGVKYTYRHGKTIRTPFLSLIYNKNSRGYQRFAVVVSKKVEKTAVGRNHLRRRLYEAIRLEFPEYSAKMDCIFVVYNKSLANLPFSELRKIVHDLLHQTIHNK